MKKILFLIVPILLFFFFVPQIQACSPIPTEVIIKGATNLALFTEAGRCLDAQCYYVATVERFENSHYYDYTITYRKGTDDEYTFTVDKDSITFGTQFKRRPAFPEFLYNDTIFDIIDQVLVGGSGDLKTAWKQEIEHWWDGRYGGSQLKAARIADQPLDSFVSEKESSLTQCTFDYFRPVGGWVFYYQEIKEYCAAFGGGNGTCPQLGIAYPRLFIYLLKNPGGINLLYLAAMIIILGLIIGFLVYLVRRKEIRLFLKLFLINIPLAILAVYIVSTTYVEIAYPFLLFSPLLTILYYLIYKIVKKIKSRRTPKNM